MDAKEVKAVLKAAREAIRSKDYKEALKQCKSILKHDKGNYNALVFVGVAAEGMEQPDQALMAYKKAIDSDPIQILAWQGLCSFYEKSGKDEYAEDLMKVYTKLMELYSSDKNKIFEMGMKLAQLYYSKKRYGEAEMTCSELLPHCEDDDVKCPQVWTQMISCLEKLDSPDERQQKQLLLGYRTVTRTCDTEDEAAMETWKNYVGFLIKIEKPSEVIEHTCKEMIQKFPNDIYPVEIILQLYLDKCADGGVVDSYEKMEGLTITLEEKDPDNCRLLLVKGYWNLMEGDLMLSRKLLMEGLQKKKSCISGWYFLARVQLKMHDKQGTESSCKKGMALLHKEGVQFWGDKPKLEMRYRLCLAKSYIENSDSKMWNQSIETCEQLLVEDGDIGLNALICLARGYLCTDQDEKLVEILAKGENYENNTELLDIRGCQCMKQGDYEKAEESFRKAISMDDTFALSYFNMGVLYWQQCQQRTELRTKCFELLLKAAKLDRYYAPTLLYLGNYYAEIMKNKSKAVRCYQKAYELAPNLEETGISLVDSLMELGTQEPAVKLLKDVTARASAGSAKWAWLRLGLYQMKYEDPTAAILSLQSALRADPKDNHCWECLGEAYLNRGSYNAALKAFTKATELDSSAVYCYYQIASIKQMLGLYTEAVESYGDILKTNPDYVPALKGLGETHLHLARNGLQHFYHKRVTEHCEAAFTHLGIAVPLRPDMSCLWKLLGDACTILHHVPTDLVRVKVPSKLLSQTEGTETELGKSELLALGGRCYGMAIKQQPDYVPLWHDLGLNYFYQLKMADMTTRKYLSGKAIQCLQRAITLDASNDKHWSALGVIAASQEVDHKRLAQHCFIKSIQVEPNNVVAWTNLGILYLKNDQIKLGHQAFKVAQSLEPSFVACWVGQAIIAELVGHEDAMDLFRHSTELGNHVESAIGYAHWVCSTLQDKDKMGSEMYKYAIDKMAAVPAASDALAKYTARIQTNPTAFNMHGLLLERQGLNKIALEAFARAVNILEDVKSNSSSTKLFEARVNYARILSKIGDSESSLKQYNMLKCSNFEEACALAYALFRAGDINCMKAYEDALNLAATDEDKSHTYAAMGMAAYKLSDRDSALSALFKCSQLSVPSLPGLKALCSLALMAEDSTLATAVLQELMKHIDKPEFLADIFLLKTTLSLQQRDIVTSRNDLCRGIHVQPERSALWSLLAEFLLNNVPDKASIAVGCCQISSDLYPSSDREVALVEGVACLGAGLHSRSNPDKNTLRRAQRAVHMHPDDLSSLCVLVASIYGEQVVSTCCGSPSGLQHIGLTLTTHVMSRVEAELSSNSGDRDYLQVLHLWCVRQYVVALLTASRTNQAHQFLQQATWLYEDDVSLQSLLGLLTQNFSVLKSTAVKDTSGYAWQLLVPLYIAHGLYKEIEKTYRHWLQSAGTLSQKVLALIKLAHLAYQHILSNDGEMDRWRELFQEAAAQVLKLDSTLTAIYLMQGIIAISDKNNKSAKTNFQRVIKYQKPGSLTVAVMLARQQLLKIYVEKSDEDGIQALMDDALGQGDTNLITFYEALKNA